MTARTAPKYLPFMLCIVIVLSAVSFNRNLIWQSNLTLWSDVIINSPNRARPWYGVGHYHLKKGNMTEAVYYLAKATGLDPAYTSAWNDLGVAFIESGMPERAIGPLMTATSLDPLYVEAWNNLGVALMNIRQYEKALEMFQVAVNMAPSYEVALNNIRIVQMKINRLKTSAD